MKELLRTLIIEDSEVDTELVVHELQKAGYDVTYERVDNPDGLLEALDRAHWDIILSDHSMPGFTGTSALKQVRELVGDIPFIVVSGTISEDAAVAMMKAGAHDYFYKGQIARLVPAVQRELHEVQERRQRAWAEKQLRDTEERLAKVFRVSPGAIAISTLAGGIFIDVNNSFLELTGYERNEVIGRSSHDTGLWFNLDDRDVLVQRVRAESTVRDFETIFQTRTGEARNVLLSSEKLEFGGEECILSVFFDVTDRNRSTLAIRRYVDRLTTVHSIDQAILAAQSPAEVAQAVVEHLPALLPCSHAVVLTDDAGGRTASVVAVYSRDHNTGLQAGMTFPLPTEAEMQRRSLAVDADPSTSDLGHLLYAEHARASIHVSLVAQRRTIGSLIVGLEREAASAEDVEIVQELGDQLAIAFENARLTDVVHSQVRALDILREATLHLTSSLVLKSILDTLLDYAIELVDADSAHIFLYRNEELVFGSAFFDGAHRDEPFAQPRQDGMTYSVVRSGEMILIPNVNEHPVYKNWQWGGAIMGLPLRVGREINGVMTLAYTEPREFDQAALRVLTSLADHAALAIHNAELYERIRNHAGDLEARVAERTEELQMAKEHVEAILNYSNDVIMVLGRDGTIEQTNPAFQDLFGFADDEVVGTSFTRLVELDQAAELGAILGTVVETKEPQRTELTFFRKDGTAFSADVTLAAIANAVVRGIVCNLRDVTERRQIEEELRKALAQEKELNELKLRFNSMVSHEFRTPLAVILSSGEMLQHYFDRMTPARRDQHLSRVQMQVRRLMTLLDEFLMINKGDLLGVTFIPEPVEMREFCRDIVEEFQMIAQSHQIEHEPPEDHPPILLDVKLMRQTISNLLSNAVKYSPAGGTIWLKVEYEEDVLVIRVADHGIGIPDDDQKRLFEVFHRAGNVGAVPGMGLGLVIAKRAAEAHSGEISFTSRVGEGTTFIVRIPINTP